jgi:hypothetical protein
VRTLNNRIRLQISHQDHFSFDSIIIDTHIMEILPNEHDVAPWDTPHFWRAGTKTT